jgi:hypothetical protein
LTLGAACFIIAKSLFVLRKKQIMKTIIHYTTVLLIVALAATAALAATYRATAPTIAVGEARAQENALGEIFFAGFDRGEKEL